MTTVIDSLFILKLILRRRNDILTHERYLHFLTVIRYLNHSKKTCNYVSLHIMLRLNYHTTSYTLINIMINKLIDAGYIIKPGKSYIKITPAGLQVLNEIERELRQTGYKLRKSDTLKITVKRPKSL